MNINATNVSLIVNSNLSLYLNNQNKTLSRIIQVPIFENANITILYSNSIGNFVSNATVTLYGFGTPQNLTESISLNYYGSFRFPNVLSISSGSAG